MTALAGLVGLGSDQLWERECRAALAAQRLYGSGKPAISGTADAVFGVDLYELVPEDSSCRTPLSDERFLFVADARLDNRAEIDRALGARTEGFCRKSDAEILFAAWSRWGEECLQLIVGDYAFAVYDQTTNRLTLVRDPFGHRPLFYQVSEQAIRFASMPSGVLAGSRLQHDISHLTEMLLGMPLVGERTCFAGVSRVLPGQCITFFGEEARPKSYWQPQTEEFSRSSQEELIERYRFHLDQAVGSRMRRMSGPLATHLSSGFDSSAVTTTAARLAKLDERIIAFTSAPALSASGLRGRPTDESRIAAATARTYGLDHVVVRSGGPLLETLRGHARFYQEPVRNVLNMDWWKQIDREAKSRGATTLLTGEMGNQSINAGGLSILSEWVRNGDLLGWYREARAAARRADVSWRGVLMNSFEPWLPKSVSSELNRIFLSIPPSTATFVRIRGETKTPRRTASRVRERLSLITSEDYGPLRKGGLAETGVDKRDPTADRRLIEFSFTIPPEQLLHDGVFRPLARAALSDRLPEAVLSVPLRAYQGADWSKRLTQKDAQAIVEEISQSSTAQELLDLPCLKQRVSEWAKLDGSSLADLIAGQELTRALKIGIFAVETERYPQEIGR
ncbi:MAG: asparagine synthetase B family protein [Sphingomicrobium sp.]